MTIPLLVQRFKPKAEKEVEQNESTIQQTTVAIFAGWWFLSSLGILIVNLEGMSAQ